jgi:hypothetical protein
VEYEQVHSEKVACLFVYHLEVLLMWNLFLNFVLGIYIAIDGKLKSQSERYILYEMVLSSPYYGFYVTNVLQKDIAVRPSKEYYHLHLIIPGQYMART